jgi:hypothetical protein
MGNSLIGFASARCAAIPLLLKPDFTCRSNSISATFTLLIQSQNRFGSVCACLPTLSSYFRSLSNHVGPKNNNGISSGKCATQEIANSGHRKGSESWLSRSKYTADIDTGVSHSNGDDHSSLEKGIGQGHIRVERAVAMEEEIQEK